MGFALGDNCWVVKKDVGYVTNGFGNMKGAQRRIV